MDSHYESSVNEVHQQVKSNCDIHMNIIKENSPGVQNTTAD